MKFRAFGLLSAVLVIVVGGVGCARWKGDQVPAGFAVIRDHIIYAPGNDPPINNTLDFTIIAIDETAVTRETVPALVDMQPGALVPAGSHSFKVLVMPHARRPSDIAKENSFTATVESGKVYYLADKDGRPVLIEARSKQKRTKGPTSIHSATRGSRPFRAIHRHPETPSSLGPRG